MDQSPWALQSLALAQTLQGQLSASRRDLQRAREIGGARAVLHGLRSGRPGALRGAHRRGRPASSPRARRRTWRPRSRTGPANKLAALAYTELLREPEAGGDSRRRERALANSQEHDDPVPRGARPDRGGGAASRPSRSPSASARSCCPSRKPMASILDGMIAAADGDNRNAVRLPDRSQHPARHLDRPLRAGPRLPGRPASFRRPTRSSIAASPAAARRWRCSSTKSPRSATSRRCYYYQGRVREGLKTAGYVDSYRVYLDIRGRSTEDPLVAEAAQARRRLVARQRARPELVRAFHAAHRT